MLDSTNTAGLPGAWRVPADLSQRIVKRSEHFRRADDRHYRRSVAITASALLVGLNTESAKLAANAARSSGRRGATQ